MVGRVLVDVGDEPRERRLVSCAGRHHVERRAELDLRVVEEASGFGDERLSHARVSDDAGQALDEGELQLICELVRAKSFFEVPLWVFESREQAAGFVAQPWLCRD